ncbi:MAG TPA: DUF885 domain-containing protein [Sphingomicrobium sp.]|nr:DUF885 domain-containing protein [Sphingomicrobium sp.]
MNDLSFSRRQALGALSAGVATIALSPSRALAQAAAGEAQVTALLDSIGENLLALSPESATSLGLDTGARAHLRAKLADRSQAGQDRLAATLRADLARAEAVDTAALTHSTRTSVEVVKSAYRTALEGFALPYGDVAVGGWRNTPYVVIQNVGAYLDVPRFLDTDHRIENAQDAEAYISRLESYATQLDGELGRLKATAAQGVVAPAFLIDKAVAQMTMSVNGAREGGGLVESLTRRTKDIPGNWADRARAIAQQKVAPALERQLAELQAQRPRATMDAGLWARPGGPEFYRWALRASTTTNMTPDEIHQMGLDQVAELHGRMDPILKKLGYTQGSVGSRMIALSDDPRYKFAEGDPGRAEIMAFIQERLKIIRAQMPRAFRTLVRGNLEVKRLPPEEEPGAPGAYGGAGSIDGSIPGKFWINLRTTDLHRKYDLPDLTHHEAIPGHVWQGEYSNQLPLIRTMLSFNAYSEGWGLYAEQLADELGVYDDFEVGRLGYLQSLAFRAIRLVVDTGLHHKRWTREQGVRYFVETNGSKPDEVASEVDRYCSWAGQACGYKIGHTEIVRQRSRAQQALGSRYDLRDFNDTVVKGGNVPLDVLAKNVDAYIATAKASAAA